MTIKNDNIDQTDVLTLECQTSDGTWKTFREIDERELFDNATFSVFIDGNADVLLPYYIDNPDRFTLRLTIKDIKGKTATSEVFTKEWPSWMKEAMGITIMEKSTDGENKVYDLNGKLTNSEKGVQIIVNKNQPNKKIIKK